MGTGRERQVRMALAATLMLGACGGEGGRAAGGDTASAAAPADAGAAGPTSAVPAEPTAQMIARGDSIFHGRAANGICFTCHGQNGEGTALGPKLGDDQWLNTDGSMQGIVDVVSNGVAQPKQFPAPMPPMGGADLSREDVIAVAGYVYSVSHR